MFSASAGNYDYWHGAARSVFHLRMKISRLLVGALGTVMVSLAGCGVVDPDAELRRVSEELSACHRDDGPRLYVPEPNPGATTQIASLRANQRRTDAELIRTMT